MKYNRVLALGAGTQSSMVAIWCDRGELPPVDVAIFADTQQEPRAVYSHLTWLEKQLKNTPVVKVTAGDLGADAIAYLKDHRSRRADGLRSFASIPLFVKNNPEDTNNGIMTRQCTRYYKIEPINQYIRREMLYLGKGERVPVGKIVTLVFGISFDERSRKRRPKLNWQRYDYPLIDKGLFRGAVINRAKALFPNHDFPRSACKFCPYLTNEERLEMGQDDFAEAVEFDEECRRADSHVYVHSSCTPLRTADLTVKPKVRGLLGMINECEGMCGT